MGFIIGVQRISIFSIFDILIISLLIFHWIKWQDSGIDNSAVITDSFRKGIKL